MGGGVARQAGSPSATIVTGPQASVAGLPPHLTLPHLRRLSQTAPVSSSSTGRLSQSSSTSSMGEEGEVVVLDGSVGGSSSLGSSAGSVSLSVSDFKSLSGHGSGQGGGGGSVTDSPTRPGQLGLFAGLTTRSVGSSSGAGGAASSDEPIVSL